jgi:glutamate transport system permease protein
MVLATLLGLLLAVGRLSDHGAVRWLVGIYIEFFRAIPLLVVIFALYFLLPKYGIELTAYQALTGGLILYNSAVLAEIFRAGILSIDKGQSEAAYGIGMRKSQVMALILLPQATRRMLPVLIAQLVVLLKDSSLGFIIGYFELLRGARSLVEFFSVSFGNTYTFQLYVAAALIYIVINVLLSQLARYVEKRTRRNKKAAAVKAIEMPVDVEMGGGGGAVPPA